MSQSSGARSGAGRAVLPRASARRIPRALLAALGLALAGCSDGAGPGADFPEAVFPTPETRLAYEPELAGAPSEEIADMLQATLLLWRRQDDGAPSLAILRRRAQGDEETAKRVLGSYGYYGAEVSSEVVEMPPGEPPAPEGAANSFGADRDGAPAALREAGAEEEEAPPAEPERRALVRMTVEPGPPYILKTHRVRVVGDPNGPPLVFPSPREAGSPVGSRAEAEGIVAAEEAILARVREDGRPWARIPGRRAVIDPETATMEVTTRLRPGPFAVYDGTDIRGRDQVSADYILSYRPWSAGEPVSRSEMREYQAELMTTRLFSSVVVGVPDNPPPPSEDHVVPVIVRVEEGPARNVSAGARYSTDLGPEGRAGFIHRNLFNNGERLEIVAEAGLERQRLLIELSKPQFRRNGQTLTTALELRNEQRDAYDELGATYLLGVERQLTDEWEAGVAGALEYSRVDDSGVEQNVFLFGLPSFAAYDDTGDLLNPVSGTRARFAVAPYAGRVGDQGSAFLQMETALSGYLPLDAEKKIVLAGRTRLGSILSEEYRDVPAPHRLYSGGGGSVRGYRQDYIGPLDADNDPRGGRSVFEVGTELRAPLRGNIGGALFVEGGSVSRESVPNFSDGMQFAAGVGVRYYSPIGPIRFDVGVPLNPRDVDDPYQLYISIGQAY